MSCHCMQQSRRFKIALLRLIIHIDPPPHPSLVPAHPRSYPLTHPVPVSWRTLHSCAPCPWHSFLSDRPCASRYPPTALPPLHTQPHRSNGVDVRLQRFPHPRRSPPPFCSSAHSAEGRTGTLSSSVPALSRGALCRRQCDPPCYSHAPLWLDTPPHAPMSCPFLELPGM